MGMSFVGVQAKDIEKMTDKEKNEYINRIFDPKKVEENIRKGNRKNIYIPKDSKKMMPMRKAKGRYPKRKGVILYTSDKYKGIPLGHAGMVIDKKWTIEAVKEGVRWKKNDWDTRYKKAYALGVKGTSVRQDARAGDYCIKQLNKDYNYNYYNISTRKKFYCSHLVYAAYLDTCGVDLNTPEFDSFVPVYRASRINYSNIKPYDVPDHIERRKAIHPSELLSGPKTTLLYRSF